MKYLKIVLGGVIGTIGGFASGLIIYAFFSGETDANPMFLILTLPLMWGLKPLFSYYSSSLPEAFEKSAANVKQLSELNKKAADDLEFFKSDREIYEAIKMLRIANFGMEKVVLYQEKVELLVETRRLGFSDEVILFLVKAKNSDIQELIQKAKEAIESRNEIEKHFWESMEIDFDFWEKLSLEDVIPKYKDDKEPPVGLDTDNDGLINELDYDDEQDGYSHFDHTYWPDFDLNFLDVEGYPKDFQHLFKRIDDGLRHHKDLLEEKTYYFGKYSEYMSEIKAKILADWGESIHRAYCNKKVIVGMPLELCTDILGSPYEEKTLETADSVSMDCKFGRSEGKRGGVTYSHHLWFKDGLLTKLSSQ